MMGDLSFYLPEESQSSSVQLLSIYVCVWTESYQKNMRDHPIQREVPINHEWAV